jgi:PAS domain S-box-containing protein
MHSKLELYQKVTPLAKLGIWERSLTDENYYWNSVIKDIFEVDDDYLSTLEETLHFYQDRKSIVELIQKAKTSKSSHTGEFQIVTPKGFHKWLRVRMQCAFEGEKCSKIYGTLEDITEQVNMVSALAEREEKFHKAFDHAPIGMALVSPTGKWLKVNKSMHDLLGYDDTEFLTHTFQDFTYPDDLNTDLDLMYQLLAGDISSYNLEKRYFHKNGQMIWVLLSVSLVRDLDGTALYFISQIKDITQRKKDIETLQMERQRLDNIINSTQVGTWEWYIPTDKTVYNDRAVAILGYLPDDLKYQYMQTWHKLIHPDDWQFNWSQLEQCFKQKTDFYRAECRMRHNDGSWIWIEIRGKVAEWSPLGKPLLMLGTYADIHERKTLEHERKRALEVISGQNNRLMNFAHIVSHNLRSHTGNIQVLLDLVTQENEEEEKKKMMQMLVESAAHLQETLAHLNEVVDIHEKKGQNKKPLILLQEIEKTLHVLSESLGNVQAKIELDIDASLTINYNPAYMESVLHNLISNAIKYRHPDRQLKIRMATFRWKNKLVMEVSDNGVGIDMDLQGHKLFGMYKTFHGNGDAKGIGLFLVKNQIEAMGGIITAESKLGVGTNFKIEFD